MSGKPRFLQGGACFSWIETHPSKLKPLVLSTRDIPPHHPPLSLCLWPWTPRRACCPSIYLFCSQGTWILPFETHIPSHPRTPSHTPILFLHTPFCTHENGSSRERTWRLRVRQILGSGSKPSSSDSGPQVLLKGALEKFMLQAVLPHAALILS